MIISLFWFLTQRPKNGLEKWKRKRGLGETDFVLLGHFIEFFFLKYQSPYKSNYLLFQKKKKNNLNKTNNKIN